VAEFSGTLHAILPLHYGCINFKIIHEDRKDAMFENIFKSILTLRMKIINKSKRRRKIYKKFITLYTSGVET
jgi:hypothetical protein